MADPQPSGPLFPCIWSDGRTSSCLPSAPFRLRPESPSSNTALYDIDVIIDRTLVYESLTVVLGLVCYGTVIVLQPLISERIADSGVVVAGSALDVAALFGPHVALWLKSQARDSYRVTPRP